MLSVTHTVTKKVTISTTEIQEMLVSWVKETYGIEVAASEIQPIIRTIDASWGDSYEKFEGFQVIQVETRTNKE